MSCTLNKLIYKKIKKYQNIVIARHIGPDPDALAGEIALRDTLKLNFPKKNILAVGASVTKFRYFGNLDKEDYEELDNVLLIVLDVPEINRVDGIKDLKYKEVIKIDHHPSDDKSFSLEIVDDTASSTCQLIAEFVFDNNLEINESIASNLFLGIVSDSDRFLLYYTTYKTFQIVSKLIHDYKLDFKKLYNKLYERPLNEIRFHGYISENLIKCESGLAYIEITPEILKKYNVDNGTPSNMINDFNFIKEVLVWIFITFDEKNNIYKVNIRSRGPIINEIAKKYNGGGHKLASGARCTKKSDIDKLLQDLDAACIEYQKNN